MASKKEKSKKDTIQPNSPNHLDPELEKKVDAMMKDEPIEPPIEADPMSAPLLPTEKSKKIEISNEEDDQEAGEVRVEAEEQTKQDDSEIALSDQQESGEEVPAAQSIEIEGTEEPETEAIQQLKLDDAETGKLVDDIVAEEADELLAIQDQQTTDPDLAPPPLLDVPSKPKSKFKRFLNAWWHNRLYRRLTVGIIMIGVLAAATVPASRYFLLNTAGVRVTASMVILDQTTSQPLRSAEVSLGGQTVRTDKEGKVRLEHLKLGSQTLHVRKIAYADVTQKLVIGWGSNPLGNIDLTPIGSRYTFSLTNFLSDKPITKAEISSGEATAASDDKGEAVLSVPQTDDAEVEITITADNYRREVVKLSTATKASQQVKLVPLRKAVYVSKRSGTYDVYKVDVDGKNEQKILAGTGSEQPQGMVLIPHPSKDIVAFVSSRDNLKNKDGFLLSTLNIIDLKDNKVTKIAQSERIQLIDWIGDRLVYVRITEGASAADPQRHRLMSYDLETEETKELASTNYFNDVMAADGKIYYSPAIYKINGAIGLFRIDADGSNKKTISNKEAWNLFRTDFTHISVSVGQKWYEYDLSSNVFTETSGAPPALVSRLYVTSPDNTRSVWTEDRDGKGTLLVYDHSGKEDKILQSRSGLKNPLRWLDNDHLIYRVATETETADYVLSLSGGQPRKISDVTNTAGTDRWYYY